MASDNFGRANESPIAAPWGSWGTFATCRLLTNAVQNSSGSGADSGTRYTSSSVLSSQWRYLSGVTDGGPAVCIGSTNGYIMTAFDGTQIYMFRIDAGGFTQLGGTVVGAWTANEIIRIRRVANDLIYAENGSDLMTRTDTTYLTGNPGGFFFDANLRMDQWTDGAVATVDGQPLWMNPGPGFFISTRTFFLPLRLAVNNTPVNDTSLQASFASTSTLTAEMTAMWLAALPQPGPGISPEYMRMFTARGKGAVTNAVNDTSLAASLASQSSLTAALTTAIPLAATLTGVSTLSAGLSTSITLQAALAGSSTVTAALTTAIPLAATLASVSTLSAGLTTAIRLQATLASVSTLSAGLTTAIPLAATLTCVTTLTADLAGSPAMLAATLAGVSTLTAGMTTAIPLAATLAGVSTLTASITTAIPLSAVLAGVTTLTAALTAPSSGLQATLAGVSTLSAGLTTVIRMQGALASATTLTGALTTQIRFAASLSAVSTLSATLSNTAAALQASLASISTLTAGLTTAIRLQGVLSATSTLTASLGGSAASFQAALESVSSLIADLGDRVFVQPFGPGIWDVREGQLASRRNPYVSMLGPHAGRLVAAESYGVAIARFAWADDDGLVRTIRTGEQRLGWVRQVFGPRRAIYVDRGLRWIRPGMPISLYVQGEFWARFAGGAQAGDTVYVSLLDGSPISGYAVDALPTPWRVAMSAYPDELAVITTWE